MTPLFSKLCRIYANPGHTRPRGRALQRVLDCEMLAYVRRARDLSPVPVPSRRGRFWTASDMKTLVSEFRCGQPLTVLASRLQRTPTSVETKLRELNIIVRNTPFYYSIYNERPFGGRLRRFTLAGGEVLDLTPFLSEDFIRAGDRTWVLPQQWRGKLVKRFA